MLPKLFPVRALEQEHKQWLADHASSNPEYFYAVLAAGASYLVSGRANGSEDSSVPHLEISAQDVAEFTLSAVTQLRLAMNLARASESVTTLCSVTCLLMAAVSTFCLIREHQSLTQQMMQEDEAAMEVHSYALEVLLTRMHCTGRNIPLHALQLAFS